MFRNMSPIVWLTTHVAGFAHLTRAERIAIHHFTLLWTVFEAQLMGTHGSPAEIRSVVERLRHGHVIDPISLMPSLAYFRDRYWGTAEPKTPFPYLRLGNNERPDVERVLSGQVETPEAILTALLFIVHRLRNNLFHGPKWNGGMADQRRNFQHAGRILMATMDMHRHLP
jgi:hypothetical protein